MKTKTVKRFYCEHCGKGGQSARWILWHEAACTKNPNRVCRYCGERGIPFVGIERPTEQSLAEVNELGPNSREFKADVEKALKATDECPACTLAALRDSGWPMWVFPFEFKEVKAAWWEERNGDARDPSHGVSCYPPIDESGPMPMVARVDGTICEF